MSDVLTEVLEGRGDAVLLALDTDASLLQARSAKGSTMLMSAAFAGHVALFEKVLSLGADPHERRPDGVTALYFAIVRNHVVITRRLLDLGVQPSKEANPHELIAALLRDGQPELAVTLIEKGLPLDGALILYELVRSGSVDAVRAYIAAGGSLDVRQTPYSPVQTAASLNQVDLVELLLTHGASSEEALTAAVEADATEVIAQLVDAGVSTEAVIEWLSWLEAPMVAEALARRDVKLVPQRGRRLGPEQTMELLESRGVTKRLEAWWPDEVDAVQLLPGGTTVPSLRLDFNRQAWPGGPFIKNGIIVDGDLTIEGTLENGEQDFGPFLVVLGNLTVKNAAMGGAPLHVEGALTVTQAFHGYYNHGITRVEGALDANLFIAQEYSVQLDGPVRGDIIEVRGHIKAKQGFARANVDLLAAEFSGEGTWPNDGAIYKALVAGKSLRRG